MTFQLYLEMERYLGELCSIRIFYADSYKERFPKSKSDRENVLGESIVFKKHLNNASIEYSEESYEVKTDLVVVSHVNTEEVLLKYIYYYLHVNKKVWRRYYVGTTLLNLSPIDLKYVKIPYPPLEVQQHIVAVFDLLYDIKNKRMKSNYELMKFLSSYYIYLEKATGRYWNVDVKLDSLLKGYQRSAKSNEGIWMFPLLPIKNGFLIRLDSDYSFTLDKKCNPYFLCVALCATGKYLGLLNKLPYSSNRLTYLVSKLSDISLKLPSKEVQKEFEKRYLQIEKLNMMMAQFSTKSNHLVDVLLSRLLNRNSEHCIWKNIGDFKRTQLIEANKCTYDNYQKITSLLEYDEKRKKLYASLEDKVIEQFFDIKDGKIKIHKV